MTIIRDNNVRDSQNMDIDYSKKAGYPVIEASNNSIIWPEGPKGRIDLEDTYEVSSVPEDPDTPLESISTLRKKGVIPE